jgi:hypothetical protein
VCGMSIFTKFCLNQKHRMTSVNLWLKLISTRSKTWLLRTSQKNVLDKTLSCKLVYTGKETCHPKKPNHGQGGSEAISGLMRHRDSNIMETSLSHLTFFWWTYVILSERIVA